MSRKDFLAGFRAGYLLHVDISGEMFDDAAEMPGLDRVALRAWEKEKQMPGMIAEELRRLEGDNPEE